MKQFQFTTRTGETLWVRNFEEATFGMSAYDRGYMAEIPVGGSMRTRAGFWIRLPDIEQTSTARFLDDAQPDERLERIATAAMAAIIGKLPLVTTNENDCSAQNMRDATAVGAVGYAKALIAELDKQA